VVATYLGLLFWPSGLNLDWDFPIAAGLSDPAVLGCGLLLAGLLVGAGYLFHRYRHREDSAAATGRAVGFGVFWFFLVLAPTSSVVPVADLVMEHRLYLASWGVFLAVAVFVARISALGSHPRARTSVALVALAVLCASLASLTRDRVEVWKTQVTLWTDVVAKSPRKARAHLGLANAYRLAGQPARAIGECRTALDLASRDPVWIRNNIRGEMASALFALSRTAEAIAVVKVGLAEKPNDSGMLGVLAMAHLQRNELSDAEAAAEQNVMAAPESAAALRVLGFVRMRKGDYAAGTEAFEKALRLEPNELHGSMLLAEAYRTLGRKQEACDVLRSVEEPNPELHKQLQQELGSCPSL